MSDSNAALALAPRRVDDVAELLSGFELFAGLFEADGAGLTLAFSRVTLMPGEVLWHQGAPQKGLYVLLDGEVQVCRQLPGAREFELARLGRGEVMGEIPLLGGGEHSATLRALGPCSLLFLRREEFDAHALAGNPATVELRRRIVAIACARLRETFGDVAAGLDDTWAPGGGWHGTSRAHALPALPPPDAYLSKLTAFAGLRPEFIEEVLGRGILLRVPRGCVVQPEGEEPDALFIVIRGAVEEVLCRGSSSRRVGFAGPGHACGAAGLLDGGCAPAASVARERSIVLRIERDQVESLWRDFGPCSNAFLGAVEADVIRSLQTADRVLSHLASAA